MRVLVLQHEPQGGPGYLGETLRRCGASLHVVRLDQGAALPDLHAFDMLLVMGGEMNVYQEERHPWLKLEMAALAAAVRQGLPVLGVCLGGQLLARALGAAIQLGGAPEVALVPLRLTPDGRRDLLLAGLDEMQAVAWHDDAFAIPEGGVRLAASDGCANQAFRYGRHAYGLQFHPEVSPAMLREWMGPAPDMTPALQALRDAVDAAAPALERQADQLVRNFLGLIPR
jgi:GMP synthase (glutamine-hydrolysing)